MVQRAASTDTGYVDGMLSSFPLAIDTKNKLYDVRNNAETTLSQSLNYNSRFILVNDGSMFPPYGILRVGEELVYYNSKNNNIFQDLKRGFAGSRQNQWKIGTIVGNVVAAETHNAIKDAVINIETDLGTKEFPTTTSLNGILKSLEARFLAPKAIFWGFPVTGPAPLSVRFQNFSNGPAVRFLWDFGDGNTSTERSPIHVFEADGSYSVKLTMLTSLGARSDYLKSDYIKVDSTKDTIPFFYISTNIGTAGVTEIEFIDQTKGDVENRYCNIMIPSIAYPETLDNDENLYLVHDSLRVVLSEDYNPGDTTINTTGDTSKFPNNGFITLTDQCNDIDERALTFWYGSKTANTFTDLILLSGFTDVEKPKRLTNITQNVMAEHHNAIKDAVIAIEDFIGLKGTVDTLPLGETMEGRINFLRKLVLSPRAWFTVNKRIGTVPLQVEFCDASFRGPTSWTWDFGDNISIISTISETLSVPNISNVLVQDLDGNCITKTYYIPNIYSPTLTVSNEFGSDSVTLPNLVYARVKPPDEAVIDLDPGAYQIILSVPIDYPKPANITPGLIRSRINTPIDITVLDSGEQPLDPVVSYIWKLDDDLTHDNSAETQASYSLGGLYDIRVKAETSLGAYRSTILPYAIDIVEDQNLYLLTCGSGDVTKTATAYEFGLISETFKTLNRSTVSVTRNYNFISLSDPQYAQEKREFLRNNGFNTTSTLSSGNLGDAIFYWAEGAGSGDPATDQTIRFMKYNAFADAWSTPTLSQINRPWNWIGLNAPGFTFFFLGQTTATYTLGSSPTNQDLTSVNMDDLTTSTSSWSVSNYANGADELTENVGDGYGGNFSVYRTTWKDSEGYILRNDAIGSFFRLKSFYRTEGVSTDFMQLIRKLADIPGTVKLEGELVTLSDGVYFFNNTGEIAAYNTINNTWSVGGPGASSVPFSAVQDSSVPGYSLNTQTLVATSDSDRRAYLSYDYSTNAFVKFNQADLTFTRLPARPSGEQLIVGVY